MIHSVPPIGLIVIGDERIEVYVLKLMFRHHEITHSFVRRLILCVSNNNVETMGIFEVAALKIKKAESLPVRTMHINGPP
jgi:hypothetical protein